MPIYDNWRHFGLQIAAAVRKARRAVNSTYGKSSLALTDLH